MMSMMSETLTNLPPPKQPKNMDTSLTVQQIQLALHNSGLWNKRSDIMVPNLSWGLLPYEADFVVMTKSGYLTEVEIKRSWEDFKADFNKDHRHDDERIYHFFYCVPIAIFDKVKDFLINKLMEKLDDYSKDWLTKNPELLGVHSQLPAVLTYDEKGIVKRQKFGFSGARRHQARKLFLEEQLQIARLGCLRYWNQQNNIFQLPKKQRL